MPAENIIFYIGAEQRTFQGDSMVVEKDYRLVGLVKRKTLFTVQIRKAGGRVLGKEISRKHALSKKLDKLVSMSRYKRQNTSVWVDEGQIVDIKVPL